MAEKTFTNIRLGLKIDTLQNWVNSSIVLKNGEVAFATAAAGAGTGLTEPVIMVKIGDGSKTFSELPWNFHAKASDVLAACKNETSLKQFINGVIADAGIATDEALEQLAGRVTTAEGAITTLNGDASTAGSVAKAIADAIAALDLANTYEEKGAAAAAEGRVNATIGTVTEGKTVVQMIEAAQEAATYDDTELTGRVTTVEGKVTTLVGEDANKSVRTIANEELAAQLIPENAGEALDTLQEIAAWIQAHPSDASAMNQAIVALQNQVKGIDAGEGTVKKYVDDAITALKIGDYALATDLTKVADRVTVLEGKVTDEKIAAWDGAATKAAANETAITGLGGRLDTAEGEIDTLQGEMDAVEAKADANEQAIAGLAAVAKSGNVNDLVQTTGDEIVFDCGGSGVTA